MPNTLKQHEAHDIVDNALDEMQRVIGYDFRHQSTEQVTDDLCAFDDYFRQWQPDNLRALVADCLVYSDIGF